MVEFLVVAPLITMLGLGVLQFSLLFFGKNTVNHASFMAARAGAMKHAQVSAAKAALINNLVPLYGGGQDVAELVQAQARATADAAVNLKVELLNPTKESFDDFADPELKDSVGGGKRVIPNAGQAFVAVAAAGANSGQTLQDANLIKLRIVYGYELKVPLVRRLIQIWLEWLDPKTDAFHTAMVAAGRLPVVTHVTQQMLSAAIEGDNVSTPGKGNDGQATDPGSPPKPSQPPPVCPFYDPVCAYPKTPGGDDPSDPPVDPVDPPVKPVEPPACPF